MKPSDPKSKETARAKASAESRSTLSLRHRLTHGEVSIGSWIQLAHPAIAEIMANAGFEWLAVDLEHSSITIREAEEIIRIIDLCGVVPLVRLSSNDPVQIKRVMDAGAHGIIVPMVNSAIEAEHAVAALRYPPKGVRGVGLARAQGYGARFEHYRTWLESEGIVIAQIEHVRGVENLDAILGVDGINGFIVGPYDLSGSLGIPGKFDHPRMKEALVEIRRIAHKHKSVAPGFHVVPVEHSLMIEKVKEGYRFIAFSTDMLFLGESCRSEMRSLQAKLPGKGS